MPTIYKETSEDWYPNFHHNLVMVSYEDFYHNPHYDAEHKYLVNVWGADDCGYERWFSHEHEARAVFQEIIFMNDVTRDQLKQLGLRSA